MRKWIIGLVLGVQSWAATPAWVENGQEQASSEIYEETGDWFVYLNSSEKNCNMLAVFDDDITGKPVSLILLYDAKIKKADVYFTNWTASSLENTQTIELNAVFVDTANNEIDRGWEGMSFTVMTEDGDDEVAFLSQRWDNIILEDFAKNNMIAFETTTGNSVEVFDLTGSAKAVSILRRCSMEVAGLNPNDPFAQ